MSIRCWHEYEVNKPWSDLRHHYFAHNATFIVNRVTSSAGECSTYKMRNLTLQHARHASMTDSSFDFGEEFLHRTIRWTLGDNDVSPYHDPPHRGHGTERSSIMAQYFVVSYTGCEIASDVITITINLCGLALAFVTQIRNRSQLFFTISLLALACGESRPLTWQKTTDVPDADMPALEIQNHLETTWLSPPLNGLDTALPKFRVGAVEGIHRVTERYIELDMLFFDDVIYTVTDEDVQETFEFFPDKPIRSREVRSRATTIGHEGARNNDDASDMQRRKFLATICKNSLTDLCRLWDTINKQVVQPSFNNARFEPFAGDEALRPAAEKLLARLRQSSTSTSIPSPTSDLEQISLLILTFITDPRALYMVHMFGSIRCDESSCAVVGWPMLTHLSDYNTGGRYRLAIPTDLVDSPSNVTRAWILRPIDGENTPQEPSPDGSEAAYQTATGLWENPSGRWRLVGKSLLIGEPNLILASENQEAAGRRFVSARKRQYVEG